MRYLITIECVIACNADRNKWNSFLFSFLYVFLNEFKREHKVVLDKGTQIMQLYKGGIDDYDGLFMQWVGRMSDLGCFEKYESSCSISNDNGVIMFSRQLLVKHIVVVYDIPNFIQSNKLNNKSVMNIVDVDQAKAKINKDEPSQTINITANGESKVKVRDINMGNTTHNVSYNEKSGVLSFVKRIVAFLIKLFGGN